MTAMRRRPTRFPFSSSGKSTRHLSQSHHRERRPLHVARDGGGRAGARPSVSRHRRSLEVILSSARAERRAIARAGRGDSGTQQVLREIVPDVRWQRGRHSARRLARLPRRGAGATRLCRGLGSQRLQPARGGDDPANHPGDREPAHHDARPSHGQAAAHARGLRRGRAHNYRSRRGDEHDHRDQRESAPARHGLALVATRKRERGEVCRQSRRPPHLAVAIPLVRDRRRAKAGSRATTW